MKLFQPSAGGDILLFCCVVAHSDEHREGNAQNRQEVVGGRVAGSLGFGLQCLYYAQYHDQRTGCVAGVKLHLGEGAVLFVLFPLDEILSFLLCHGYSLLNVCKFLTK